MTTRGIGSDISKVQIESDEHSIFSLACREEVGIGGSCKSFRQGCLYIVSKIAQRGLDPSRQVLIQLEA